MCEKIFQLTATAPAPPLSLLARWFSGSSFPGRGRSVDKNSRAREREREREGEGERTPWLSCPAAQDSVSTTPLNINLGQPYSLSEILKSFMFGCAGKWFHGMLQCKYQKNKQPAMGLWDEAPLPKLPPSWLPRPVQVSPPSVPSSVRGRRDGQPRLPNCHRRSRSFVRPSVRLSVRQSSSSVLHGRGDVGVIGPLRRGYSEPTTNIFQGERERETPIAREGGTGDHLGVMILAARQNLIHPSVHPSGFVR